MAEYLAVIRGLEEAMSLGAERVQIRSDSELLVKQINGQYKVKNEGLRPLYLLVKVLMEKFTEVSFLHINREQNKEADWLANKALDAKN